MIHLILLSLLFLFQTVNAEEISYSMSDSQGHKFDEKLLQLMNYENGVYIEVGANNGINQSNTKRFEEFHGWTGFLFEPSPDLFEELVVNRPNSKCYPFALGSFEQDNTYVTGDFDGNLMSSIEGNRLNRPAKTTVLMRSLQSVLDEEGITHINFFSLDVEGFELNVLRGIDFNKVTFDYLLIEVNSHHDDINELLFSHGYEMIENFSNYNPIDNPSWDGTHNDYLYKRSSL